MNHALERTHAPHVDPEWTNAFIVEARLANLDGTTIGDALAEIDAHVVSSGESAKATFGDPRSYAQALATSAGARPTSTVGAVTAPAAQTIGVILIPIGIVALRHHHRVDITTGIIIAAALVLIPWVILSVRASTLLRAVTHTKDMRWAVRHRPLVRRTCHPTNRANASRRPTSGVDRRGNGSGRYGNRHWDKPVRGSPQ